MDPHKEIDVKASCSWNWFLAEDNKSSKAKWVGSKGWKILEETVVIIEFTKGEKTVYS